MLFDHPFFAFAWKAVAFCCQVWVGLALLGIVPGFAHTDGWFARIVGPLALLGAAVDLIGMIRRRPV